MHYLTLSWDDGFLESSLKTAAIFEKFGLRTEFNVVASQSLPGAAPHCGDFVLWNELQARGHVIQPHGYNHTNKTAIPFVEAKDLITRCLDIFSNELDDFNAKEAIFNFPYNASTPKIEDWLPSVVRAFRTGTGSDINPLPRPNTVKLTTTGSEQAEECLDKCLAELMSLPDGWLLYTAHGLDGEGWGPVRSAYLDQLLDTFLQTDDIQILPARDVLALARVNPDVLEYKRLQPSLEL